MARDGASWDGRWANRLGRRISRSRSSEVLTYLFFHPEGWVSTTGGGAKGWCRQMVQVCE